MKKGTSVVPLIMGIIGGVLSVPSAICSGACAAGLTSLAGDLSGTEDVSAMTGGAFMGLGIAGGLLGLIGGILGKPLPIPAGIIMLISVALVAVMAVPTMNILGIVSAILLLVGCALCFAQKKEEPGL
ncbi:MAG: hypothetical protein LBG84_06890 [Treponema sp.]|jgi:hypothetical protein|nr:hypothetical protein [Treponema sp.]